MTNIPPANELRQEMTAALTDQVQILRDLLVQLRALTRSTLRAPDVTAEENTPTTERTNKRRNIRNPERRNQGNRARILYIGGGPSPSILTVAQQQSYCQYHRCAGHETTCCRQLKDVLFGKYQRGEISVQNYNPSGFNTLNLWNLRQQLRQENPRVSERGRKRNRENEPDSPPCFQRRINVIMGGLTSCNDSVRSIRAHQRRGDITNRWNVWSRKEIKTFGIPTANDDATTFTDTDAEGISFPHNDPLVIEIMVADCEVSRVLVDTRSWVNLIFQETLQKMELRGYKYKPKIRPLTSFAGETTLSVGTIKLPVHAGGITKIATFTIIDKPAVYNIIIGTWWLHDMEAVPSSYHQCLKFPKTLGTHVLKGSQGIARACSIMGPVEMRVLRACNAIIREIPTEQTITGEPPREAIEQVPIDDNDPERRVRIGSELSPDIRAELIDFLKETVSTFAWKTTDMIGIDPSIICHELNIDLTYKPIKQKRRKLGPERAAAVNAEVERHMNAGSIREVNYLEWIANPVVVMKNNGSWRVCVDFTDLN